jgi:hypothetical protein
MVVPARLRVVRETGVCSFCWRTLPREELHISDPGLMCNDEEACCDEFRRWDYGKRWPEHPQYPHQVRAG